jgi:hypothetical protein
MFNQKKIKGEKVMKTNRVFFAFAIAVVAASGLFALNCAYAEQASSSPFAVLSSSAGSSTSMQLVRGHWGGGFHGGFRGGHAFHRGHFGRHFGRRFYGGYGGAYYVEPYEFLPECLDWTWDPYLNQWVCNYAY